MQQVQIVPEKGPSIVLDRLAETCRTIRAYIDMAFWTTTISQVTDLLWTGLVLHHGEPCRAWSAGRPCHFGDKCYDFHCRKATRYEFAAQFDDLLTRLRVAETIGDTGMIRKMRCRLRRCVWAIDGIRHPSEHPEEIKYELDVCARCLDKVLGSKSDYKGNLPHGVENVFE